MGLDCTVEEIIGFLGHDGSDLMFSGADIPQRGFTVPEMTEFALTKDVAVIQLYPEYEYTHSQMFVLFGNIDLIHESLEKLDAVAIGNVKGNGRPHAVTWDHNERKYLDPNGMAHDICPLTVDAYLCLAPLKTPLNILKTLRNDFVKNE